MASQLVHLIEPVISLLATLIGIISMTYFIWESRKTARNYIKLAYFGVALYTGITNLANIIFWMVSISTQSFIPQLLTFLDFFEFTSLRLLRSVALGATFIKLKTSHSWCYTPSLLRSICLFILLSWITVSFSYIATLALDQKEVRWNCSRPCCFFYGHHLLSKCKIAVDIVYSLLLAALICVSVAKSAKTSPEEVMKGWSEEKVEFFVLNNRLYSIYLPCLLLLVGQELVIQCILSFREIKDKSAAELLDGYERIVRSLEPVLLASLYYFLILRKHIDYTTGRLLGLTRFEIGGYVCFSGEQQNFYNPYMHVEVFVVDDLCTVILHKCDELTVEAAMKEYSDMTNPEMNKGRDKTEAPVEVLFRKRQFGSNPVLF